MNYLGDSNKKYESWGRGTVLTFGIPAYKDAAGHVICLGAKGCLTGCYAQQGRYIMPAVKNAEERRLALTKTPEFVATLAAEIRRRAPRFVRVHDAGDFYSLKYLKDWLAIASWCPRVRFLAYSKAVPLVRQVTPDLIPHSNFRVVLSEGGRWDHAIDRAKDLHARVFRCVKDLRQAGYVNATHDDLRPVWLRHEKKIGLTYHGWKSRAFAS